MLCQVCKQNQATVHVTEINQEVPVSALGGPLATGGGPVGTGQAAAAPSTAGPVPGSLGGPIAAGSMKADAVQAADSVKPGHVAGAQVPGAQVGAGSSSASLPNAGSKGATASNGSASSANGPQIQEQHVCEPCAHAMKLPYGTGKNSVQDILKLIKAAHPQRTRAPGGLACPDCGITLVEFRQRGRLGCPKDYEVFGAQLRDLLERIHGSSQHVGRAPSTDGAPTEDVALKRMQRITELRAALDAAIRDEAYEAAAKLRDELRTLQKS